MLNKLLALLGSRPAPVPSSSIQPSVIENVKRDLRKAPRYPPFDEGMPLVDVEEIIESQIELIDKLRTVCGFTPEAFDHRMMTIIRNYAKFVHLLPATDADYHKGAGGLFRFGLEVGYTAMQSAGGKIFGGRESAEKRKILQPRWVYASFIAGLLCELHRPVTTMSIFDQDGNEWEQYMTPLFDWAKENNVDKYFIKWHDAYRANSGYATSSFHFPKIIPADCFQYLHVEASTIVEAMSYSITGTAKNGDGNLIAEIVKTARSRVIENDLKANPSLYGRLQFGGHIEPYVTDVMRELVAKGDWKVNTKQARVWYTSEGMFVIWQPAFNDIMSVLRSRNIKGFPNNADSMAEMLLYKENSMLEMNRNAGPFWEVMLPGSGKLATAVKIIQPGLLMNIDGIPVSDLKLMLPNFVDTEATVSQPMQDDQSADRDNPSPTAQDASLKPAPQSKAKKSEGNKPEEPAREEAKEDQHKKQETVVDPDFYLSQVGEDTRMLIGAIRRDFLAKESEHPIWMSAKGLVISTKEFNSHGIPPIKVIEDLRNRNWFVIEANRLLIKAEKDGVKVDAYLINRSIAEAIGFKEPENA